MNGFKKILNQTTLLNPVFLLITLTVVFTLVSPLHAAGRAADETQAARAGSSVGNAELLNQPQGVTSPATDLWRQVRQRNATIEGTTQVKNVKAGVLIDPKGNEWRKLRREKLMPYGGYFILGVTIFIGLLFLLIKKAKIPEGRSGKTVKRMSTMQRISHWFMAFLIGFMALTGLLLLFGRTAIIPLLGAEAFSPIASASKEGHNLFGPLVIISLLMMLIYFIRHNWPARGDIKWLLTLGGILSKKHLKVGFFNAGEKILFWFTIILGLILSATGLLLLFPTYEQTVNWTQLALVIHAIAALLLIAMAFAHVWMVRTVEGTIDAMIDGQVDENWAKSHHSTWYEKDVNPGSVVPDPDTKQSADEKNTNIDLSKPDQKGAY